MNCTNCGAELRPNSTFCHACGAPILDGLSEKVETAEALLQKATELRQHGNLDEELATYDAVAQRFASVSPAYAAEALLRKAGRLKQLGSRDRAMAIYREIGHRFGNSADSKVLGVVQQALVQEETMKAEDTEAISQREKVIKRSLGMSYLGCAFYYYLLGGVVVAFAIGTATKSWAVTIFVLVLGLLGAVPWYGRMRRQKNAQRSFLSSSKRNS